MVRHLPQLFFTTLGERCAAMVLELKTERLVLRPMEPGDADAVYALANNWKVARMLGRMPFPYRRQDAVDFIGRVTANDGTDGNHVFAVTIGGALVGACGIHLRDEHGLFEIGYWLGEPFWGKGYATEAAHRLVRFAFEEMDVERLLAGHFLDNPASGHVLEKAGFRRVEVIQRECLARGEKVPCAMMELTRAEFEAVPAAKAAHGA